jgi:hypothetical protein
MKIHREVRFTRIRSHVAEFLIGLGTEAGSVGLLSRGERGEFG